MQYSFVRELQERQHLLKYNKMYMRDLAFAFLGAIILFLACIFFSLDFSNKENIIEDQSIQLNILHENNSILNDTIEALKKQDSIRKESIFKLVKYEKNIRSNIYFYNAVALDSIIAKYTH